MNKIITLSEFWKRLKDVLEPKLRNIDSNYYCTYGIFAFNICYQCHYSMVIVYDDVTNSFDFRDEEELDEIRTLVSNTFDEIVEKECI
jgi:hypothetical protein